jgi:hypothetical protein
MIIVTGMIVSIEAIGIIVMVIAAIEDGDIAVGNDFVERASRVKLHHKMPLSISLTISSILS